MEGQCENQETTELIREASRTPQANINLKLVATSTSTQAHICVGNVCIPPVNNPSDLRQAVANAVIKPDDPFTNLMEEITNI